MTSVKADYYELLGVPPDADLDEIRRAFHHAARDVHQGVSDSTEAEQHFRDLAEAYSALSRPASRLLYDRFGYRGRGSSAVDDSLWDGEQPGTPGWENIRVPIELRAFEAKSGTSRLVRYEVARRCGACEGRGTTGDTDPECPACGGSGREFAERQLKVHIPSGLEDGAQLRVSGEGDIGDGGGAAGDLLLDVHVVPEPGDSRVLRVVSFVLFAAAIAILVVYVLLS